MIVTLVPTARERNWAWAAGVCLAQTTATRHLRNVGNSQRREVDNAKWTLAALVLSRAIKRQLSVVPHGRRITYKAGPYAVRTTEVPVFAVRRSDPNNLLIAPAKVTSVGVLFYGYTTAGEAKKNGTWHTTETIDGGFFKVPLASLHKF